MPDIKSYRNNQSCYNVIKYFLNFLSSYNVAGIPRLTSQGHNSNQGRKYKNNAFRIYMFRIYVFWYDTDV